MILPGFVAGKDGELGTGKILRGSQNAGQFPGDGLRSQGTVSMAQDATLHLGQRFLHLPILHGSGQHSRSCQSSKQGRRDLESRELGRSLHFV